jgi:hypothetical protein
MRDFKKDQETMHRSEWLFLSVFDDIIGHDKEFHYLINRVNEYRRLFIPDRPVVEKVKEATHLATKDLSGPTRLDSPFYVSEAIYFYYGCDWDFLSWFRGWRLKPFFTVQGSELISYGSYAEGERLWEIYRDQTDIDSPRYRAILDSDPTRDVQFSTEDECVEFIKEIDDRTITERRSALTSMYEEVLF